MVDEFFAKFVNLFRGIGGVAFLSNFGGEVSLPWRCFSHKKAFFVNFLCFWSVFRLLLDWTF